MCLLRGLGLGSGVLDCDIVVCGGWVLNGFYLCYKDCTWLC